MAVKDTLWTVCIVSSVLLLVLWVFFTFQASEIISETGVQNKFAPLETLLWMFSLDNSFFIFVLFLFIAAVASFGIVKFHPAFQGPPKLSAANAYKAMLNNGLNRQVGGFLKKALGAI